MSPRNIRPAWLAVNVDGKPRVATGPRARTGNLDASFYVREMGAVLPLLEFTARASEDGSTVEVIVTDVRTGAVRFRETFHQ